MLLPRNKVSTEVHRGGTSRDYPYFCPLPRNERRLVNDVKYYNRDYSRDSAGQDTPLPPLTTLRGGSSYLLFRFQAVYYSTGQPGLKVATFLDRL